MIVTAGHTSRSRANAALVVDCEPGGRLDVVIHDTTGIGDPDLFVEILSPASVADGLSLLREVEQDRLTTPWELAVTQGDHSTTLSFVGAPHGARTRILGAVSPDALAILVDEHGAFDAPTAQRLVRAARMVPGGGPESDDAAVTDLTRATNELTALHRELASANARLEAQDRRRDELLAMVAHDLRGPLGTIGAFAAALRLHLGDVVDERSDLMLDRIAQVSERMLDIVDDLLDVTAIRNDQLDLELAPVDVCALVVDVADSYRFAASHKGIRIDVDRPEAPVRALADAGRLLQVFDNLLNNAVKYTPIDVGAVIRVSCTPSPGTVTVAIEDEGPGIPPDEQDGVFVPFGRSSNQPTGGERSTGLGLPIAASIVQAHGGRIELDSEVGVGTTFRVVLPVDGPTESRA